MGHLVKTIPGIVVSLVGSHYWAKVAVDFRVDRGQAACSIAHGKEGTGRKWQAVERCGREAAAERERRRPV
tara:strand:- start:828 stop:1040 length:213 start_codon:yes stop_codon:yes gene_type:complete